MVELLCPHGGGTVGPDDVNPKTATGHCPECGEGFSLLKWAALARRREEVPRPSKVRMREDPKGVRISILWPRRAALLALPAALVFAAMAFVGAMVMLEEMEGQVVWLTAGAGVASLWLGYDGLARLLNRTRLELGPKVLRATPGPLPWPGRRTVEREAISQLYCQVRLMKRGGMGDGPARVAYVLMAAGHDGREWALTRPFGDQRMLLFVEQELERALGLRDRPMEGEAPR